MSEVTRILSLVESGDPSAAEQLLPLVYDELRKLAKAKLAREKPGQTLDATGLVHEAYLRLVGPAGPRSYQDRREFFLAAAEGMRRILIDKARRKKARKRGGDLKRQALTDLAELADKTREPELLALDEALRRLAEMDPVKAQLVELRYFAGLSGEQAAQVMGISPTTADRYWAYARAWLQAEVRG